MKAATKTQAERRQEQREKLEAAVRELMTSEGWIRWLNTRSLFHNYSFNNTLLIAMQRPTATRVAGFKAWQKLGRQVRKGEKSIKIFAPMTVIVRDANEEPRLDDNGQPIRRTFFKLVSVFDIEQTDGEALPEIPMVSIDGDDFADRLPALEAFASSMGISVAYEELHGRAGGYFDPSKQAIVVESTKSANGKVRVLVHELAHALGVGYDNFTRADAEVIVESVTHIVCSGIGFDTSGESFAYIASWGSTTRPGSTPAVCRHGRRGRHQDRRGSQR